MEARVADTEDFNQRTTYLELYRVHKFCQENGMEI